MDSSPDSLELDEGPNILEDSDVEYEDDFEPESDDDDVILPPTRGLVETVVDMGELLTKLHKTNSVKHAPRQITKSQNKFQRPREIELHAIHELLDETLTGINAMAAEYDEREKAAASIQKCVRCSLVSQRAALNCPQKITSLSIVFERWKRLKTYLTFRSRILCASLSYYANNYMLRIAIKTWKTKHRESRGSLCRKNTFMSIPSTRGRYVITPMHHTGHMLLNPSTYLVVMFYPSPVCQSVAPMLAVCGLFLQTPTEYIYPCARDLFDPTKSPFFVHNCLRQIYESVHQWLGGKATPIWHGTSLDIMYYAPLTVLNTAPKHPVAIAVCGPFVQAPKEPCMYPSVRDLLNPTRSPFSVHNCPRQMYESVHQWFEGKITPTWHGTKIMYCAVLAPLNTPPKHSVVMIYSSPVYQPVVPTLAVCGPFVQAPKEPCMYPSVRDLLNPTRSPFSVHNCPRQIYESVYDLLFSCKSAATSNIASPGITCSKVSDQFATDSSKALFVTSFPSTTPFDSVEKTNTGPKQFESQSRMKRATCDADVMESGGDVRISAFPNADGYIELEIDSKNEKGEVVDAAAAVESSLTQDEFFNWELV